MRTQLHIGEIAQLLGVTPKTIRHYHKIGLLAEPERTEAGYRLYGAQDLLRLQRIRRLQSLGLSLKQIKVVLGDSSQEHSLRQVLQSLDQELCAQIAVLEERRQKIRTLLDEHKLESVDALPVDSPTFQYVQEQLAAYHSVINPALWEQEAQLYALLDNLHWTTDQQTAMKEMAEYFIQHFTEHPEEYQQLLALGDRLMSLASLPEDAPEITQLIEDFDRYFVRYPFMLEMQKQVGSVDQESPFSRIFAELITPMFSAGQQSVLNKIARRQAKEGNTLKESAKTFTYTAQRGAYITSVCMLAFLFLIDIGLLLVLILLFIHNDVLEFILLGGVAALYGLLIAILLAPLWTTAN